MPRYLSTSPFEQVIVGLSVGAPGVVVHPAPGRLDPQPGSTVTLAEGDELDVPEPLHFPGAYEIDPPPPTSPTAAPTAPTVTAEEPTP